VRLTGVISAVGRLIGIVCEATVAVPCANPCRSCPRPGAPPISIRLCVCAMSEPRLLVRADVPDLLELSRPAGWNQTAEDWLRLLELSPLGSFGIVAGGRVVASTTAICYEKDLAWIGMVLTDPAHRGNGYASRLMQHALHWLNQSGIAWIKLDATDMGQPIYSKLGFENECELERWKRPAASLPSRMSPVLPGKFEFDLQLDLEAFGARRRLLIESLAREEAASIPGSGYAMGRPGTVATYFGPCVARTVDTARGLLEWFLSRHSHEDIFWDLFPGNASAASLAREYGFTPVRHLVRMAMRGAPVSAPLTHETASVYAIAAFEYG